MNSSLFSNAMLLPQDPFMDTDSSAGNAFTSWNQPNMASYANGFQSDGPMMQSIFPGASLGTSSVPPGLFAAIASAISQYFQGGQAQTAYSGNTTPFQNVQMSSTGDPHDAINGTTADGSQMNAHWNNMQSHNDLLSAPNVAGGFKLSSQVGSANAQGATMNQSVTATANHGHTAITLDANGNATLTQGNTTQTLTPNETLQLGSGLSVTDNGSSLLLHAHSPNGGMLTTTLSDNGQGGVDVNAQGQNVALGGYLVNSQ